MRYIRLLVNMPLGSTLVLYVYVCPEYISSWTYPLEEVIKQDVRGFEYSLGKVEKEACILLYPMKGDRGIALWVR